MITYFTDWEIVIDHNLLVDPLIENSSHVDPVSIDLQIREDGLDSVLLLSQASDCTEEVAIPDSTLKNVLRGNSSAHEDGSFEDLIDSLPDNFVSGAFETE